MLHVPPSPISPGSGSHTGAPVHQATASSLQEDSAGASDHRGEGGGAGKWVEGWWVVSGVVFVGTGVDAGVGGHGC